MASSARARAKSRKRTTVKVPETSLDEIAPRSSGVGTIAAYLADMRAIEEHCESCGLPYRITKPLKDRLKEECERRHFPGPDPRAGGVLDSSEVRSVFHETEACFWRWIEHRLEYWRNAYLQPWRDYISYPHYRDLIVAYGHMHDLDLPGAPPQPYTWMSEPECRDALRRIANELKHRDARIRGGAAEPATSPSASDDEEDSELLRCMEACIMLIRDRGRRMKQKEVVAELSKHQPFGQTKVRDALAELVRKGQLVSGGTGAASIGYGLPE